MWPLFCICAVKPTKINKQNLLFFFFWPDLRYLRFLWTNHQATNPQLWMIVLCRHQVAPTVSVMMVKGAMEPVLAVRKEVGPYPTNRNSVYRTLVSRYFGCCTCMFWICLCLSIFLWLSISIAIYFSRYLSVCLSLYISCHPSIHPSVYTERITCKYTKN